MKTPLSASPRPSGSGEVSQERDPSSPFPLRLLDVLFVVVGLRLVVEPSTPVAVALVALALARVGEKFFVDLARVYRNSSIDARRSVDEAAESAARAAAAVSALEGRLTRLETRAGWADNQAGRR